MLRSFTSNDLTFRSVVVVPAHIKNRLRMNKKAEMDRRTEVHSLFPNIQAQRGDGCFAKNCSHDSNYR